MANSFASDESIQCPFCGKSFNAQFWVIVDIDERPDLLAQLRNGERGRLTCPHCKNEFGADSGVVLYDPHARGRFRFSPPEGMTDADAREYSFQLVSLFRERAGPAWRDAWLGDGVPIIPRDMLRFELLTDLSGRWRSAMQLANRANVSADPGATGQALEAWHAILNHPDFEHLPPSFQWSALNNTGGLYLIRYRAGKARADLDQAIHYLEQVLQRIPPDHPDRNGFLTNLDRALTERFALSGDERDLDVVIAEFQKALPDLPPDSTARPYILGELSRALLVRYDHFGNLADLDQSIDLKRQALSAAPEGSRMQLAGLVNLALGLRARYLRLANLADLEEGIEVLQRASGLVSPDDPERAIVYGDLGGFLNHRYEARKNMADLEQAIAALEQALPASPDKSEERVSILTNLASARHNRWKDTQSPADMDAAIAAYQEAIDTGIGDANDRAGELSNLAYVLRDRYEQTGSRADLDASIAAGQRALEIVPGASPHRAMFLNSLARGLEDRYTLSGSPADLDQARAAYREACERGLEGVLVEGTLRASQNWGRWALERAAWPEAREAHRYGIEAVERLMRSQALRQDKETWLRQAQSLHIRAAYAAARCNEPVEAVVVLEHGRARLAAEALERGRRDLERLAAVGQGAILQRYQAAAERLAALEAAGPRAGRGPAKAVDADERRQALRELDEAIAAIQQVPGYQDFFRAPAFPQIQSALTAPFDAAGAPAVGVYLVVGPRDGMALIVHAGGVRVRWLDFGEHALDPLLVRFDADGRASGYLLGQLGESPLPPELDTLLAAIGDTLIRPLVESLAEIGAAASQPPLVLVPTGRLSLLPLHAARYQSGGRETALLDEYAVCYAPSAQVLGYSRTALKGPAPDQPTLLAVANPLPLPGGTPALHFAEPEAEQVAALFDGRATVLAREAATRAAVAGGLGTAGYYHFACHGTFNPARPLDSGVIVGGGEMLTLADLIGHHRLDGSRLGVLSACQTAITDFENLPEEAVGLPAGFLQAGVPGVIGSLWSVNDLSTALLMIKFYEAHLKEKLPPVQALRAAQRWLREATNAELSHSFETFLQAPPGERHLAVHPPYPSPAAADATDRPYAHPYYWAAFALYGL